MNQNQVRQGDVLLIKIGNDKDVDLSNAKLIEPENGRVILAHGEATGHHHSLPADMCSLFGLGDKMVVVVEEDTHLAHQEHAELEVTKGMYWVVGQTEYVPAAPPRRVAD